MIHAHKVHVDSILAAARSSGEIIIDEPLTVLGTELRCIDAGMPDAPPVDQIHVSAFPGRLFPAGIPEYVIRLSPPAT